MTCKDTINLLSAIVPMHVIKVVNDFESSSPGGIPAGGPPYWYASSDSGESKSNGVLFKTVLSDKRVPDGSKFFHMEGVDLNNNADIQRVGFKGDLTSYQIPAYSNPDSIYFNIYVYGFGVVNSKFRVVFNEDDNGDGIYGGIAPPFSPLNPDPDIEDEYSYSFKADWKGWRLLSFKYSDAVLSDKAPNGTQGNHVREPHKIINMAFALMSDPAWQSARLAFDYPVFTYGYPFDPNH
jgi:hypothetical protein